MYFGGRCTLVHSAAFVRPIPSVSLSVRDKLEHCKTVRRVYGYYGEPIGSHYLAIKKTHLQPPTTIPSPSWDHNPYSKLVWFLPPCSLARNISVFSQQYRQHHHQQFIWKLSCTILHNQ